MWQLLKGFCSFQAWHLPSSQACLLSTVSIPLSFPSSHISSWALLTRWSRVNQSDLTTAISCDDSETLQERHSADQLRLCLQFAERQWKSTWHTCFLRLGTFAVLSIMVGIECLRLAPESDFSHFNATLNATIVDTDRMNDIRLGISGTLACLTAIIQVLIAHKAQSFKLTLKWHERDEWKVQFNLNNDLHVCRLALGSCRLGL